MCALCDLKFYIFKLCIWLWELKFLEKNLIIAVQSGCELPWWNNIITVFFFKLGALAWAGVGGKNANSSSVCFCFSFFFKKRAGKKMWSKISKTLWALTFWAPSDGSSYSSSWATSQSGKSIIGWSMPSVNKQSKQISKQFKKNFFSREIKMTQL